MKIPSRVAPGPAPRQHAPQIMPPELSTARVPEEGDTLTMEEPMCPCEGGCPKCQSVQTKLQVGSPHDPLEYEADQTADRIMRMPATPPKLPASTPHPPQTAVIPKTSSNSSGNKTVVQRQTDENAPEGEEKDEEEGDLVQLQPLAGVPKPPHPPNSSSSLQGLQGQGCALPPVLRSDFETRFGEDFSGVRIHTHAQAGAWAEQLQAKAFTSGQDIVFGPGQYAPSTSAGRSLLAHELAHVLQQRRLNPAGSSFTQPKLIQCAHLPTVKLAQAVTIFQARILNPDLLTRGQFYWSGEIKQRISNIASVFLGGAALLRTSYMTYIFSLSGSIKSAYDKYWRAKNGGGSAVAIVVPHLDTDWRNFVSMSYNPKAKNHTEYIATLRRIFTRFFTGRTDVTSMGLLSLMGTGPRTASVGRGMYTGFWGHYKPTEMTMPNFAPHLRVDKLEALSWHEYQACGSAAVNVVNRYLGRGGSGSGSRSKSKSMSASLCSRVVQRRGFSAGLTEGDVVAYRSNLPAIVSKIKTALDDGFVIHTRVLSGKCCGGNQCRATATCGCEEHSIVIIGYDGNQFVFWDPDSTVSKEFGGGFGYLFHDTVNKRFSTAENATEFKVDDDGDHTDGQHRYQVLRVLTM